MQRQTVINYKGVLATILEDCHATHKRKEPCNVVHLWPPVPGQEVRKGNEGTQPDEGTTRRKHKVEMHRMCKDKGLKGPVEWDELLAMKYKAGGLGGKHTGKWVDALLSGDFASLRPKEQKDAAKERPSYRKKLMSSLKVKYKPKFYAQKKPERSKVQHGYCGVCSSFERFTIPIRQVHHITMCDRCKETHIHCKRCDTPIPHTAKGGTCYTCKLTQCWQCKSTGKKTQYVKIKGRHHCPLCANIIDKYSELPETALSGSYLEERTCGVILSYYAGLPYANYNQRFRVKDNDLRMVARYLAGTASCELRHSSAMIYSGVLKGGVDVLDWFYNSAHINHNQSREYAYKTFLGESYWWPIEKYIWFLRGAAYVFYSPWTDGSFGGPSWAGCCWHSANWLADMITNNGYASPILWELWLSATHNNGGWLSKLGVGNILPLLDAGFLPAHKTRNSLYGFLVCIPELQRYRSWLQHAPDEVMAVACDIWENYPQHRHRIYSAFSCLGRGRESSTDSFKLPEAKHMRKKKVPFRGC